MPDIADVQFPTLIGGPMSPVATPKKPKKSRPKVLWQGVQLSRVPTSFEQRVLSLAAIPQRMEIEASYTLSALEDRRLQDVLSLDCHHLADAPETDLLPMLRSAQARLARYGAFEVEAELARQGARLTLAADEDDPRFDAIESAAMVVPSLAETAALHADRLSRGWQSTLKQLSARVRRAGKKRQRDWTQHAWQSLAEPQIRDGLSRALRQIHREAYAYGRHLRMRPAPEALALFALAKDPALDDVDYYLFTAVHDTNLCDECAAVDGTVLSEDDVDEYEPPYYLCQGGDNCRCELIAVVGNYRDKGDVADALDLEKFAVATEAQARDIVHERGKGRDG